MYDMLNDTLTIVCKLKKTANEPNTIRQKYVRLYFCCISHLSSKTNFSYKLRKNQIGVIYSFVPIKENQAGADRTDLIFVKG